MKVILAILVLSNMGWIALTSWQQAKYEEAIKVSERLYYENQANDMAATECAIKTGWRYNCADGSQKVSCE